MLIYNFFNKCLFTEVQVLFTELHILHTEGHNTIHLITYLSTNFHRIVTELHIFSTALPPSIPIALTDLLLQDKETPLTFLTVLKDELQVLRASPSETHRGRATWPPSLKIPGADCTGRDRAPSTDTLARRCLHLCPRGIKTERVRLVKRKTRYLLMI